MSLQTCLGFNSAYSSSGLGRWTIVEDHATVVQLQELPNHCNEVDLLLVQLFFPALFYQQQKPVN